MKFISCLLPKTCNYYLQKFVCSRDVPNKSITALSDKEMLDYLSVVKQRIPKTFLRGCSNEYYQ